VRIVQLPEGEALGHPRIVAPSLMVIAQLDIPDDLDDEPKRRPLCDACIAGLEPFTIEHFRRWCSALVLDNRAHLILEPFQEAFVVDLFAGFQEAWLILPEGNAKTTLMAAIALYHLDHHQSPSVPIAASSREQVGILFAQAAGFVTRTPGLRKIYSIFNGYREIRLVRRPEAEMIKVWAGDAKTADGVIPTLAIVEEGHRHKDLELYNVWTGKLDKRGGQIAMISTAGEPGSDFEEARAGLKVDARVTTAGCFTRAVTETTVIHDWAVAKDGDLEDLDLVKLANPLRSITVDSLRRKRQRPTMTLARWARYTGNRATRSVASAIGEVQWDAARVDEEIPEDEPIMLGVDGGRQHDTTAIVPLWITETGRRLLGPATILEPPADGKGIRDVSVKAAIEAIRAHNPVVAVVLDPYEMAGIIEWLRDELDIDVVLREPTNPNACEDRERFMEALREGVLVHAEDPGLRQHVLNATTVEILGRTKFERPVLSRRNQREQRRRVIDALDAAAMVNSYVDGLDGEPEEKWEAS
jgi:phage terminase large subunit-like protein